ncbi:MAG: hypothetical protein V3S29_05680 [bacterium]
MAVLNFEAGNAGKVEAEAISEEISKVFVHSKKFTVIDRTLTGKIMEEWALQLSGVTDEKKALKVGKLYNVQAIVTGKLLKFPGGGWQVSGVMLDAQTGVRQQAETIRHRGDFFTLLDQKVPGLARALAGLGPAPAKMAGPPEATRVPPCRDFVGSGAPPAGCTGAQVPSALGQLAETYWKRTCAPCDYTKKTAASSPMLIRLRGDGTFSYKNPRWKNQWIDASRYTWKLDGWSLVISWNDGRAVAEYEPTNARQTRFRGKPRVPAGTPVRFTLEKITAAQAK